MADTDTESSLLKGMHSDASVGFENDGFSSEAIIIFFLPTNEYKNDLKTIVRNHWTFHLQSELLERINLPPLDDSAAPIFEINP